MGVLYNIIVVNTEGDCLNSITQQFEATACTQDVIVKFTGDNNAVGPFNVYTGTTGTTAVYTGLTRLEMIQGVSITLEDPAACITPTPTPTTSPTPTPTPTPTEGITSTPTPTPTVTPTDTPDPTSSPTPTSTETPTPTSTTTGTPTPTPTASPAVGTAYLFIEPQSGSTEIGQYLFDNGYNFFGFTNLSAPDTSSPSQFNIDMNGYVSFPGWTGGTFPAVRTQSVPKISGGVDSFGNSIVAFNFTTHEVPEDTVQVQAWYTWIIPTGATNNLIQTKIDYNAFGNPNSLTTLNMDSIIYSNTFNYTGSTIPTGVYRVYTTFADLAFYLDNDINTIYFKGNTVI
jgi:hypothetical protein